jgi:hypothetical protein
MKAKVLWGIALALLLTLLLSTVAWAAVSQKTIDAILADAKDGTIDGTWSGAEIQATLDYIRDNPVYQQYTKLEGVLEDYLAGLQAPGEQGGGQLAFTGAELLLVLGAGASLVGSGVVLRRRRA